MFYKKKTSLGLPNILPINSAATLSRAITGLDEYTEYEFQMLAFTSVGDGPKSSVEVVKTNEDGKNKQIICCCA